MTIEEMRAIKKEFGLTYELIAKETGIPVSTVSKVLSGVTESPRRETAAALAEYFSQLKTHSLPTPEDADSAAELSQDELLRRAADQISLRNEVRESAPAYNAHKFVTIEERDALPEEKRTELIDGVLYDMASPSFFHQVLCSQIFLQLQNCIQREKKNCHALVAPFDVVLKEENPATVVQPDVLVICDKTRIRGKNGPLGSGTKYYGGPELVIEVLSPSTRKKDAAIKLEKYLNAGVHEFWIVDPDNRKVMVYNLDTFRDPEKQSEMICLYTFDQKVPVLSSGGTCEVDFGAIMKDIDSFYG